MWRLVGARRRLLLLVSPGAWGYGTVIEVTG